jgi:hypothetical protein
MTPSNLTAIYRCFCQVFTNLLAVANCNLNKSALSLIGCTNMLSRWRLVSDHIKMKIMTLQCPESVQGKWTQTG